MRQILIVHSSTDMRFESFFSKILSTVVVKTLWETYEALLVEPAAKEKIQKEILDSDAIFIVLSTDERFNASAKVWFPWATNLAKEKDIWVFEHCEDLERVSVLIPKPGNYVAYYITNAWSDYVSKIAETYEKPKAATMGLPEAIVKPLTHAEEGAFFEPSTGFALFDYSTARAIGLKTVCPNCSLSYNLHVPSEMNFVRCPSCGRFYEIQQLSKAGASTKE